MSYKDFTCAISTMRCILLVLLFTTVISEAIVEHDHVNSQMLHDKWVLG